ncbi:hypothetical protein WMC41_15160 [Shinella yambaruensis]|uniref:hypothetical protein n=1 Tax=Shinella yambaruensis TaxID=415996 RepID=UPI003D793F3B
MRALRRIVDDIRALVRASSIPHSHLRDRLSAALALTFLVDIVASGLLFLLEKNHSQTDIHTFWDALFFTTSQLTTLSSAMANPVTVPGKVLCLLIDIYAITVVATVAGMFGAFFSHRSADIARDGQRDGPDRPA